jgi:hypothetical protein
MKTYTIEELSQKVKKILDLHAHMNKHGLNLTSRISSDKEKMG